MQRFRQCAEKLSRSPAIRNNSARCLQWLIPPPQLHFRQWNLFTTPIVCHKRMPHIAGSRGKVNLPHYLPVQPYTLNGSYHLIPIGDRQTDPLVQFCSAVQQAVSARARGCTWPADLPPSPIIASKSLEREDCVQIRAGLARGRRGGMAAVHAEVLSPLSGLEPPPRSLHKLMPAKRTCCVHCQQCCMSFSY